MERRFVCSSINDSVVTLLEDAQAGDIILLNGERITILADIPFAHKIAVCDIPKGEGVFKYGERIGYALSDIHKGEWVHLHNLGCDTLNTDFNAEYGSEPFTATCRKQESNIKKRSFMGYARSNGTVGVRNHVLIIPSVLCVNTAAKLIAKKVPGVIALTHGVGCGQYGYDAEISARTLKAMGRHPNVYAVIVLGLGCERFQSQELYDAIKEAQKPVARFVLQEDGDIFQTVEKAAAIAEQYLSEARVQKRVPCDIKDLMVATKCGGTDATSGLAANPVVGYCCDRIIEGRGSGIISEVGELLNTEHILRRRAVSGEIAKKIDQVFLNYRNYLREHCDPRFEKRNDLVSPGNEDGGVTNVVEKALGGVVKSGTSPIEDVLEYADPSKDGKHGFFLMNYGNHDGEVVTGMVGCGAQICLFTTGRGTPTGFPFVPVIKITGNEETHKKMQYHFDFDASPVISGEATIDQLGKKLLEQVLRVANGEETKSEHLGADELFCIARHS